MQKAFSKAHFGELTKQLDVNIHAIERIDQERVLSVQEKLHTRHSNQASQAQKNRHQ